MVLDLNFDCWSIAALKNIASILGGRSVIVIDTVWYSGCTGRSSRQHLHVVERGDRHARLADLACQESGRRSGSISYRRERIVGRLPVLWPHPRESPYV